MNFVGIMSFYGAITSAAMCGVVDPAAASVANLVTNGSFEGTTGVAPSGRFGGGSAFDGYGPVAIAYGQEGHYPVGAQGEAVPVDDASSASPDAAGANGVYFVSDEAKNLSLYQFVYLTPGSYKIGFDSYDTSNGASQPHDAVLTAEIARVQLTSFKLSSVSPGSWSSHEGEANIKSAGDYIVRIAFQHTEHSRRSRPE